MIKIVDLKKQFGDKEVTKGVNLEVPEGKMTMFILPVNDEVVFGGIGSLEQVEQAAKALESGKRLDGNSQVATTAALLPKDAIAVGYLNPQGAVNWVSRIISQVMPLAPIGQFPEFPETPPVGFAAQVSKQNIDIQMVVPKETIEGVKKYIEQMQDQFQPQEEELREES